MTEKRERGTGRIFLRGSIFWCQYYSRGRQIRVSTGEADEKRAERFLRRKLGGIANGIEEDLRSLRYAKAA